MKNNVDECINYPVKYMIEDLYEEDKLMAHIIVKCYILEHRIMFGKDGDIAGMSYIVDLPEIVKDGIGEYIANSRTTLLRDDIFETYEEAEEVRDKYNNYLLINLIRNKFDYYKYNSMGISYLQDYMNLELEQQEKMKKFFEIEKMLLGETESLEIDKQRVRKLSFKEQNI